MTRAPRRPGAAASDEALVRRALVLAEAAVRTGDVPIGAVVVDADGRELAAAGNCREALADPTAHAVPPGTGTSRCTAHGGWGRGDTI